MSYIEDIKAFADKQFLNENHDTDIGFECFGQWIIDPWMENSARWEIDTQKAFELYGAENMLKFIKKASDAIGMNNSTFPIPGHLLADLKDAEGNEIKLWKHGRNDYAVYFENYDSSVRGTAEDISEELKEIFPGEED